ncbi:MAG: class I SAM-dependent methyltransferase [Bacteroidetes bacterium]|nr:class I SAM-dependent methyltransferase [Bacteroidota bacterium]
MSLIHYISCPSCHSENIRLAIKAVDYTVSHQTFEIWECVGCGLRFTQDVPDAATIGPYYRSDNYISHSNTNQGLVNRLYHMVRKQTLSAKYRLISSATRTKQGKLLDIGAGTGAFVAHMQERGWEVTGLEPDDVAREKARTDHRVQLLGMENLFSFPPDSFDAITLWHVLEHVHDLHPYIEQLKKLIKRDGRIFIAVPNYTSYDAGIYEGFWAAYDVPRHLYHFSPDAMEQLLNMHGLQLQYSQPMWFDSFYISMLSEKYKNGKGNNVKAAWNGLVSNMKAFVDKSKCSSLIYVISK